MLRLRLLKSASLPWAFNKVALLLLLAVVCANVYRRLVHDSADLYKCNALLHQGQWLDSPDRNPERKPFQNWHVPGCLLHDYTASDIADCNEDGQILFVGDTTVRQVFWAAAKKLDSMWVSDRQQELDRHENLYLERDGARLSFLWDPLLNSTAFMGELDAYTARNKLHTENDVLPDDGKKRSALLFVGGGLWHARHLADDYLPSFTRAVDRVGAAMSSTHDRLASPANIRAPKKDEVDDQIFFAPIRDPLLDRLSPSREITITQSKVWTMNEHLQSWSTRGLTVPWIYREMTSGWPELVGESGLHVTDRVAAQMANVMLNYRCNAKAAQKHSNSFSRTCCSDYKPTNWISLTVALLLSPVLIFTTFNHYCRSSQEAGTLSILSDTLAVYILAAVICFTADRTHVFDKIPREFANIDFRIMLGISILICLINVKPVLVSTKASPEHSYETTIRTVPFLPRAQSDEFKGWMQIYVLVYAYTKASGVMDFYQVFRVFVALYILLSGYGHTTYFLRTKDFSLQRSLGVIVRLNMLPLILALALSRPYTSYYVAPLVTFWFLVVFLTLRIGQRWNECFGLLLIKIGFAALLITCFIHMQGVLEVVVVLFSIPFRAHPNIDDIRFHLSMDKYAVFVGIIVAALHIKVRSMLRTSGEQSGPADLIVRRYFILHQIFLATFAAVTIPTFWILTRRSKTRDDYNWWMPYIAWLPALAFVILRNAIGFLRARYCASFAWLGHISFELHLLSQHIWLAGDGKGLLRVGFRYGNGTFLGDKWRDLIILTPILVWLSWRVHEATKVLTSWLIHGHNTTADRAQEGKVANRDIVELPGWHRTDGSVDGDAESRRRDQLDERRRMLWRVGGVAAVTWLSNLLSS